MVSLWARVSPEPASPVFVDQFPTQRLAIAIWSGHLVSPVGGSTRSNQCYAEGVPAKPDKSRVGLELEQGDVGVARVLGRFCDLHTV